MVNLSNLQDIEPINISVNLSNPDIMNTAVSTANESTGGYLGLGIGIVIYIMMIYIATKEDGIMKMDFIKASLLGSGVSLTVMLLMLGLDMISSFIHLMWFLVIFILSLLGAYVLKDKQ